MHKTSNSQQTISSKPTLKSKSSAKGLTLDPSKFDSKSTGIGAFLNERNYYSPTNKPEKSLLPGQTKSPRKNNLMAIITDNLEPREGGEKQMPQTTKTIRSSFLGSGNEKSRQIPTSGEKIMSTKAKDSQCKIMLPNYESFLARKTSQTKDSTNKDITSNLKDTRFKILEEPPKKQSISNNLSLALSNGFITSGSNSHRAPLNSPHSDYHKLNAKVPVAQLNRKNSQRSDTETEHQANRTATTTQKGGIPQNHPLNTILSDLGSASPKSNHRGVSRINIGNVSNSALIDEKLQSPKEDVITSPTNDLMKLLSDKNKEIHRLATDKMELKSTLESLNGEIMSLKNMKSLLREKEKMIEDLQSTLYEAVKESDELKKEFERENILPSGNDLGFGGKDSQAQGGHISGEKMEGIKSLIAQLKSLTDGGPGEAPSTTLELKNSILENLNKKKLSKQNKRENSYDSFYLEKKGDKTPPVDSYIASGHPRNYSIAFEEKRTGGDSPYYDAHRRSEKVLTNEMIDLRKVRSDSRSKILGTSNVIIKKGDSFLGTPRKIQVNPGQVENPAKVQPHTTTAVGNEIMARKISHDHKLTSFGKKQVSAEPGSTFAYTTDKDGGESFDIAKGLSELKNRIARMLNKHQGDHLKLKETHELYFKKLQDLMKE